MLYTLLAQVTAEQAEMFSTHVSFIENESAAKCI